LTEIFQLIGRLMMMREIGWTGKAGTKMSRPSLELAVSRLSPQSPSVRVPNADRHFRR
jgi:hypothetical protein